MAAVNETTSKPRRTPGHLSEPCVTATKPPWPAAVYEHLALTGPYRECLIEQNEGQEKKRRSQEDSHENIQLPSNSNYGDQPIQSRSPDN